MSIKLTVNGATRELDIDPQMPLLWALRDHLQLTGTKFGCGMALCGACTVHIDVRRRARASRRWRQLRAADPPRAERPRAGSPGAGAALTAAPGVTHERVA